LLNIKQTRSTIEYYFTCSPFLPGYLLRTFHEIEIITYLDADLYFFARPDAIYAELSDGSILIVEHRFGRHLWTTGRMVFTTLASWLQEGRAHRRVLRWWQSRCLEWCFDRREPGRFADQKYLDDWPTRFEGVVVLRNPGAGLAPWNWMNYRLVVRNSEATVDGQPLIFYHFHGVRNP